MRKGVEKNMNKKKILLIEDDLVLRETLVEFLEKEGFATVAASDGEMGLKIALKGEPDLVILDVILPKRNGFEVLEELKSNTKMKNIPVMVLTNLASLDDIEKALSLGATSYLVKGDYKLQEIVEKIRLILL